ncbi:hypothetical protein FOA52_005155 [Chlamydomonas sp. UWO 241]|nr:hypothetical protein FOA52_005155 [Chlamydomonas sp. UWO 241]
MTGGSGGSGNVGGARCAPTWRAELRELAILAAPNIVQGAAQQAMLVTDQLFLGRIGTHELAAASLGNTYHNVMWAFLLGASTALDTLGAQAHGASNHAALVTATLTAAVVLTALAGLMCVALLFGGAVARAFFGQAPEVADLVGRYCVGLIPGMAPLMLGVTAMKYLQIQGRMMAPALLTVVAFLLNIGFNALLVRQLGFEGAPLATSASRACLCVMLGGAVLWHERGRKKQDQQQQEQELGEGQEQQERLLGEEDRQQGQQQQEQQQQQQQLEAAPAPAHVFELGDEDEGDEGASLLTRANVEPAAAAAAATAAGAAAAAAPKGAQPVGAVPAATVSLDVAPSGEGSAAGGSCDGWQLGGSQEAAWGQLGGGGSDGGQLLSPPRGAASASPSPDLPRLPPSRPSLEMQPLLRISGGGADGGADGDADAVHLVTISSPGKPQRDASMRAPAPGPPPRARAHDEPGMGLHIVPHASPALGHATRGDDALPWFRSPSLLALSHSGEEAALPGTGTGTTSPDGSSSLRLLASEARAALRPALLLRFSALALPGGCMMAFEASSFDVTTAMAGHLGVSAVTAAHAAMLSIIMLTYFSLPFAIATAATIRVGTLLGAGLPQQAQLAGRLSVIFSAGFMVLSACAILASRNMIGFLFSADLDVVSTMALIAPYAALFQVSDGFMGAAQGILRACGRQAHLMVYNLLGFWVFGVLLGYLFCFHAALGVQGLWIGIAVGDTSTAVLNMITLYFVKWDVEAKRARALAQDMEAEQRGGGGSREQDTLCQA